MPSVKVLEQKKAIVADLAEKFGKAASGVLVKYQGITVEQDTKLRASLREAGVEYAVVKNTLIGRACDEVGFGAMKEHLEGMNAIAISYDDPVAPAKILKQYAEKIECFELRAGFLDGAVIDTATVEALADTPTKEVMIARILGSIQGPITGLAVALNAVVEKGGEAAPAEEAPAAEEAAEAPAAE
ncbi:MAG: 50S ribosomal protein L10 [Ruminococcaceae bacterium]|nr:50S ribosomal protein L10 [Oscillospiraceae bacterium]